MLKPILRYSKFTKLIRINRAKGSSILDKRETIKKVKCACEKKKKHIDKIVSTDLKEKRKNEVEEEEEEEESEEEDEQISFDQLGVPDWLIKISKSVQINYATKIQRLCLPLIFEGKNVIGSGETGSGKTICYCWGILNDLHKNFFAIFALILIPTRELALQITEQFNLYGAKIGVHVISCIGGFSLIEQRKYIMNKPHVVVGTPARISNIMENCIDVKNCFKRLRYLVLDEADVLLQDSFEDKLKIILQNLPKNENKERRTLFFSATITNSLRLLKETFPNEDLCMIDANPKQKPVKNLDQRFIYVEPIAQMTYLVYLLKNKLQNLSGIIFTDNSYTCQLIHSVLVELHISSVTCIHSQKEQKKRFSALSSLKNGSCKIMVATDLISRGIDIPKVSFVINYDFPNDPIQYIHRVGRTARANKKGIAISFIDKRDMRCFKKVKEFMKTKLKPYELNKEEVLQDMFKIGRVLNKCVIHLEEQKMIKEENEQLKYRIFNNE